MMRESSENLPEFKKGTQAKRHKKQTKHTACTLSSYRCNNMISNRVKASTLSLLLIKVLNSLLKAKIISNTT